MRFGDGTHGDQVPGADQPLSNMRRVNPRSPSLQEDVTAKVALTPTRPKSAELGDARRKAAEEWKPRHWPAGDSLHGHCGMFLNLVAQGYVGKVSLLDAREC